MNGKNQAYEGVCVLSWLGTHGLFFFFDL